MADAVDVLAKRWFEEVWNQRRDDVMDELLSPDCRGTMVGQGEIAGAEQFKAIRAVLLSAFPDLSLALEDVVVDGSKAVVRWIAKGTHSGNGLPVAPTGIGFEFSGMTMLEFQEGKLVRGFDSWDHGGLMDKLRSSISSQ